MDKLISVLLCILLTTFSLAGCLGDTDNETSDKDDGLSENISPDASDIDADGLGDEEERRYGTDPLVYDTDGDGVADGWEIDFGYDPLNGSDGAAHALCEWYDGNETSNTGIENFCNSWQDDLDRGDDDPDITEEIRNYTVPTIWEVVDLNNTTLTNGAIENAKCGLIYAWPEWDGNAIANIETLRNSISDNREGEVIHVWSAIYEDSTQEVILANIHNFLFTDDKATNHTSPYKILVENGSMVRLVDYSYISQTGCEGEANIGLNSILQLDTPTPVCGDAVVEVSLGESCDDGNTENGDGCSSTCEIEPQPTCGDAVIDATEECDDGNTENGDGCSSTCEIEPQPTCGDAVIDATEECDDGNTENGDGCSSTCEIEPQPACGDGVVDANEQCDDGNTENGDGCDSGCNQEDPCANVDCGEGSTCDDGDCIPNYFQPGTRDELKNAVDDWIANSTKANLTYGNISTWDTSLITDMSELFYNNETFNDDISQWDVSSVTTTEKMFKFAQNFNQDISGWDVSNVVYMNEMFYYATDFNQDIGYWDVSSVTDMEGMFFAAIDFNQDLVNWDVSRVTDTNGMFHSAISFNGDISQWDTSSVTKLNSMFYAASSFNQDISGWDVSNVNDWYGMNSMFYGAESFNQDISQWDVSNVNNMYGMFYNAKSFNQDLSDWDVSGSTNLNDMFEGADDLSDENKCEIHNSFSSSNYWNYDWAEYCSDD